MLAPVSARFQNLFPEKTIRSSSTLACYNEMSS
jgi:hypothetical protein